MIKHLKRAKQEESIFFFSFFFAGSNIQHDLYCCSGYTKYCSVNTLDKSQYFFFTVESKTTQLYVTQSYVLEVHQNIRDRSCEETVVLTHHVTTMFDKHSLYVECV